jgi:ketosteroid isomerase-like protein
MNFDAMATAVDWLDAYRAGDIESLLNMYADDAMVECGCGGSTVITGAQSLRAYWEQRLKDYPASELDDLQPANDGAAVYYVAQGGVVGATLEFNTEGRIAYLRCGPTKPRD